MIIDRENQRKRVYNETAIVQPQFADTAILKSLLDKLVALGVIGVPDRFHIYSEAAAAIGELPGDNVDLTAELLMLADEDDQALSES